MSPPELIAVSGLTGCGKSETLRELVAALAGAGYGNYDSLDCGSLPRQWAKEEGLDIEAFIQRMGPELDPRIDERTRGFYRDASLGVAVGRLACHESRNARRPVFRVWLYCPTETRAARRGVDPSVIDGRDQKDSARFRQAYGITYPPPEVANAAADDLSPAEIERAPFDLLVSTLKCRPGDIAERIISCGRCWSAGNSYAKIQL